MMFKKKSLIIGLILLVVVGFIAINGIKNGSTRNSSPVQKYTSLSNLHNAVPFTFNIPEILVNETDLKYESIAGNMVKIWNDNYLFKAAPFVHEGADVGGNYEVYEFDETYDVSGDTNITLLRIRYNTSDDNIILTWKAGNIAYYLDIKKREDIDNTLAVLNLTSENIVKQSVDEDIEGDIDNTINTFKLDIFNAEISIPEEIVSTIIEDADNEVVVLLIDGTMVLNISKQNNIDESTTKIELQGGYKLSYLKRNPFDSNTDSFKIYNKLIEHIEDIANSFVTL